MKMDENDSQEPVPISEEELQRRRRQVWMIVGVMILSFCTLTILLFVVGGLVFGADLRHIVQVWLGR